MSDFELLEFGLRIVPQLIQIVRIVVLVFLPVLPVIGVTRWVMRTLINMFNLKGV